MTSPPATTPRRIAPASAATRVGMTGYDILWPSGAWFGFLIRFFARARSRDMATNGVLAAEWRPKIENNEKGALFRVKPSERAPSPMPAIELVT